MHNMLLLYINGNMTNMQLYSEINNEKLINYL